MSDEWGPNVPAQPKTRNGRAVCRICDTEQPSTVGLHHGVCVECHSVGRDAVTADAAPGRK